MKNHVAEASDWWGRNVVLPVAALFPSLMFVLHPSTFASSDWIGAVWRLNALMVVVMFIRSNRKATNRG